MIRRLSSAFVVCLSLLAAGSAAARPALVIEVESGRVIHAEEATRPWFPASLTKLMTAYVALQAVKAGRVSLDTPLIYTKRAQAERPSKMGFPVGTIITLDNALKLLLVKSANDLAVVIGEGVSGSAETFVAEMNMTARALGMEQSRFVNPNGWWDPAQVTSARDMAILGRRLWLDFPQYRTVYALGGVQLGARLLRAHNGLLGRFEGADGMKTGFTCPSGFNLVATAGRGDRRLIAVVLGHSSARERTERAAELLARAFEAPTGVWSLFRTGQSVEKLPAELGEAPNLRAEVCGKKRGGPANVGESDDGEQLPAEASQDPATAALVTAYAPQEKRPLLSETAAPFVPLRLFLGLNPNAPDAPLPANFAAASLEIPQRATPETKSATASEADPEPKPAAKPERQPPKAAARESAPAAKPAQKAAAKTKAKPAAKEAAKAPPAKAAESAPAKPARPAAKAKSAASAPSAPATEKPKPAAAAPNKPAPKPKAEAAPAEGKPAAAKPAPSAAARPAAQAATKPTAQAAAKPTAQAAAKPTAQAAAKPTAQAAVKPAARPAQ